MNIHVHVRRISNTMRIIANHKQRGKPNSTHQIHKACFIWLAYWANLTLMTHMPPSRDQLRQLVIAAWHCCNTCHTIKTLWNMLQRWWATINVVSQLNTNEPSEHQYQGALKRVTLLHTVLHNISPPPPRKHCTLQAHRKCVTYVPIHIFSCIYNTPF